MAMAALVDDLIEKILRRLPPSEPACFVHAALVCKRWCGIISDAGFRRRLLELHDAPPTVAAIYNAVDGDAYVARFTPCASFPPRADRRGEAVLDCRHGRVLLRGMPPVGEDLNLAYVSVLHVWDPVTDEQWELPMPNAYPHKYYDAVVLCAGAATGTCNHLDCHGGSFIVVLVGNDLDNVFIYAYFSEAAAWSKASTIHLEDTLGSYLLLRPALVSGDVIYFILDDGHDILKYELVGHVISMLNPPSLHAEGSVALVEAKKDGVLGITDVDGYNLHVWRVAGSNGDEHWVKHQVIRLDMLLPSIATGSPSAKFDVVGFGEGTNIIFISTNDGIFVVWRDSGRVMKAGGKRAIMATFLNPMFSFQRFYIPALGPAPGISFPPSQSPEVSTEKKRKGDTSSSGKSVRSNEEKKLKHDPSLHGPAMGTRSKTAFLSGPAMSTRSKRKLSL